MAKSANDTYLSPNLIMLGIVVVSCIFHGCLVIYSFPNTYDNYVHTFFADHYRRSWFEPWENRWYTGFTTTSYPPLIHQLGALLSYFVSLKSAMLLVWMFVINNFVVAVYRYSRIWVSDTSALVAASFAIVCPSILEAMHVFGQLPTITGIGFLLHATTETYKWVRHDKNFYLISALSLFAVTISGHHVTTIFGMIFFVAPVVLTAVIDKVGIKGASFRKAPLTLFIKTLWEHRYKFAFFGAAFLFLLIFVVFPYWYWSKTDPITQVPIPHGSRDNFLTVKSSGVAFFVIPWGIVLALLPFLFKTFLSGRNIFIGLSFTLLVILGTGGTTPIPKLLLGENAFNILTLDRFTFWASVMAIPFVGDFIRRFIADDYAQLLYKRIGRLRTNLLQAFVTIYLIGQTILIVNLIEFRPLQPQSINIDPITKFLERDEHYRWRYLTLGFGDQVAWLAANTTAKSIDGNYHSARRVPELTSRAIERLENSKFNGVEGLGSLQQFLTIPEKYHLKYIFSNDKFYDPLLHYCGWHRVQRLENGIMVWEKQDIKPLPPELPMKVIPQYQKIMWGTLPLFCLANAILINLYLRIFLFRILGRDKNPTQTGIYYYERRTHNRYLITPILLVLVPPIMFLWAAGDIIKRNKQARPEEAITAYYDALDFKRFKEAHSYLNPEEGLNFEQYVLEISVADGLLNSYAKLDNIRTEIVEQNDSTAKVLTQTDWVTPISDYSNNIIHNMEKKEGKWYLEPPKFDLSLPPDQFIQQPTVRYFKQGKRRVSTDLTTPDDVVDRPTLNIIDAKLVEYDSIVSIVGEVQNTDNLPAHVTITAILFDSIGREITKYNAKFNMQHKILPKEKSPFRIDFEELSWRKDNESKPTTIDPNEFNPFRFEEFPYSCKVFAKAVAENTDVYKYGNISNMKLDIENDSAFVHGDIVNTGVDEITIPELIVGYYDDNCKIRYVDHHFVNSAVRPQRKNPFQYSLIDEDKLTIHYAIPEKDKYVNGLQQAIFQIGGNPANCEDALIKYKENNIKIGINAFVGVPSLY